MVSVEVALPEGFGGASAESHCTWAGDWCGRFVGAESIGGQRVERYSFGGDGDATLFAHATCHHLEVWSNGFAGAQFTVTVNGERVLPGVIGSRKK